MPGKTWPRYGTICLSFRCFTAWRTSAAAIMQELQRPLLRTFFGDGELDNLAALAQFFSIAWMNSGDAAYVVGGSLPSFG